MTVIEVRGRGGQLIERYRSHALTLRIGRALDNDLIVEDEHVCAHHLQLSRANGGWRFEDLGSLNGVRHLGHATNDGILRSGETLRIGNTILRVYDEKHPVEPALRLTRAEATLAALGGHGVWPLLAAASLAVAAVGFYWGSVEKFEPEAAAQPVLFGILGTLLGAAVWAFVGRLLRHKASFFAHFSVWMIFGLLSVLASFAANTAAFNASSQRLETILGSGLSLGVLSLALWSSLTLATNLRSRTRVFAALGVAAVGLAIDVAAQLQVDTVFLGRPDYYARLQGPALLWATPASESRLLYDLPALFDRADADLEEDRDEAAEDLDEDGEDAAEDSPETQARHPRPWAVAESTGVVGERTLSRLTPSGSTPSLPLESPGWRNW